MVRDTISEIGKSPTLEALTSELIAVDGTQVADDDGRLYERNWDILVMGADWGVTP